MQFFARKKFPFMSNFVINFTYSKTTHTPGSSDLLNLIKLKYFFGHNNELLSHH